MVPHLKYNNTSEIIDYSKTYFKTKPRDCILYSKDNAEFKIHKELLGQTEFMREMLKNSKDYYNDKIEILCPCTMEELKKVVHFLYFGEIECEDVFDSFKVQENLNKIFGFPESLNQNDQIASLLDDPSLSSIIGKANF